VDPARLENDGVDHTGEGLRDVGGHQILGLGRRNNHTMSQENPKNNSIAST
jgi:hypothetical protein